MPKKLFGKGNKIAPGGKRKGAGRKRKDHHEVIARAELIAKDYIETKLKPILDQYITLARGRWVQHYNQQTGAKTYREFEVDPATLRHFVDKFIADEATTQNLNVNDQRPDQLYDEIQKLKQAGKLK